MPEPDDKLTPARAEDLRACIAYALTSDSRVFSDLEWSEWRDSNPRPLVPQTSALTGLRYTPTAPLIVSAIA